MYYVHWTVILLLVFIFFIIIIDSIHSQEIRITRCAVKTRVLVGNASQKQSQPSYGSTITKLVSIPKINARVQMYTVINTIIIILYAMQEKHLEGFQRVLPMPGYTQYYRDDNTDQMYELIIKWNQWDKTIRNKNA